jgi:hypothetical protein
MVSQNPSTGLRKPARQGYEHPSPAREPSARGWFHCRHLSACLVGPYPPWTWTNSKTIRYGSLGPPISENGFGSVCDRSAEHRGTERGAGASERGT